MKYFLHDTNAFNDEKITELFIAFGYEGLGLFYTILEKIAQQEKPIKTEVLKSQLRVGKKLDKCWEFMEQIGIICSTNGETFNKQLLNYSEKYQIKKQQTRERIANFRAKQQDVTQYKDVTSSPKVKVSKVKVLYLLGLGINHWNKRTVWPSNTTTPVNTTVLKKLLPTCRKETKELQTAWNKISPTEEEWETAIKAYVLEIANRSPNNDYCNHRFSLYEFIKQKNGYLKFLNK